MVMGDIAAAIVDNGVFAFDLLAMSVGLVLAALVLITMICMRAKFGSKQFHPAEKPLFIGLALLILSALSNFARHFLSSLANPIDLLEHGGVRPGDVLFLPHGAPFLSHDYEREAYGKN